MEVIHQHSGLLTQLALIASAILILSVLCTLLTISFGLKYNVLVVNKSLSCGVKIGGAISYCNLMNVVSESKYKSKYLLDVLQPKNEAGKVICGEELYDLKSVASQIHERLVELEKSIKEECPTV